MCNILGDSRMVVHKPGGPGSLKSTEASFVVCSSSRKQMTSTLI